MKLKTLLPPYKNSQVLPVDYQPSEGEEFIAEYFQEEGFTYEREKTITGLTGDEKSFRRADFYLPKYKLYVEFNGLWNNSKSDRERYREKKAVFAKNRIPCVYLFPENLGILYFTFPKRATKELKYHNLKRELTRMRIKWFNDDRGSLFLWLLLSLFILAFGDFNWQEDRSTMIALIVIALYQVYRFFLGYKKFFLT